SIPDSSLRKRLGYEVLSFSLQAHSLSQECIDKLVIFSGRNTEVTSIPIKSLFIPLIRISLP
ncbi:hypothetical protein AB0V89_02830, partial [Escherichia coli]